MGSGGKRCGGKKPLVATNPARVYEENSDEKDNRKEYDDEEQSPSSDLEVSVIDFCVVPSEWSCIWAGHGDLIPRCRNCSE